MKKWKPLIWTVWLCLLVPACGGDDSTTEPEEESPLSPFVSIVPPNNATNVPKDVVITVTFREDMDSSTINTSTFLLEYNPPVPGTVIYDKESKTGTFRPDSLLICATTYRVTLTRGIKDSSGIPIPRLYSWVFKIAVTGCETVLPRTGQTSSYFTGDDGAVKAGVAWPVPRFTDNNDGTVTDQLTGLMWLKDGSCLGYKSWQYGAFNLIDSLNTNPGDFGCGDYTKHYVDWRLPNINELESLTSAGQSNTATWLNSQGFTDVKAMNYWSSTINTGNPGQALAVNMWTGHVDLNDKYGSNSIWAVRDETSTPAQVWKTGQVTSYRPGDDGELQAGAKWPRPRFSTVSDSAVTDLLTGLMWARHASTPDYGSCTGGPQSWYSALSYIQCLNDRGYGGYSDWRLPNKKELFSLIDRSQYNPALPADHGFVDVDLGYYWTSTTSPYEINRVWIVGLRYGDVGPRDKASPTGGRVWPVRGGR